VINRKNGITPTIDSFYKV